MRSKSLRKGLVILIVFAMMFAMGVVNLTTAQALPGSEGTVYSSANEKVDVLIGFYHAPGSSERALVRSHGGEISRQFKIVDVIAASMTQQAADALAKTPGVRYVEPDGPVYAHDQTVPWGIDRVFGDETYSFGTWVTTGGDGIAVAILDTGIDENHEDLPKLSGGKNTIDETDWGSDGSGHGTHVAGTVAALDNEVGVVGVGPEIVLYAVKVLSDGGSGTIDSLVAGIEWAVENDILILNMSLGADTHYQTLQDATDAAYEAGHLIVSSAGNSGNPPGRGDNVSYPAAYDSVIAVAASTDNDRRSSFSSTGPAVELIAPGSSILSTLPGNSYGTYSGTSMASPHAAGAVALVWAANTGLTNVELRTILQETAEDLGLSANHQGYGLVRADLAVRAAGETELPATGNIEGTVKDKDDVAIEGAAVVVEGTDLSATTDADGHYLLEDVPEGEQEVTASADGYNPVPAKVTVEEDVTVTQDFVLGAIPTYTVSGTVKDNEGNALEGATVTIEGTAQSAATDGDGNYSLVDLEEGTYEITASKDGYSSQTKNVKVDSDTTLDFKMEETEDASGLTINHFELTDTSNRAWARVTVEWAVSSDVDLASVKTEMLLDGDVVDSETSTVSGVTASGAHDLRVRGGHGKTYEVKLTVTDAEGNSTYETKEIDL